MSGDLLNTVHELDELDAFNKTICHKIHRPLLGYNHYTRKFSVLAWGCNWILFITDRYYIAIREGYVFTGVCHSAHGGLPSGGSSFWGWGGCLPSGGIFLLGVGGSAFWGIFLLGVGGVSAFCLLRPVCIKADSHLPPPAEIRSMRGRYSSLLECILVPELFCPIYQINLIGLKSLYFEMLVYHRGVLVLLKLWQFWSELTKTWGSGTTESEV